MVNLELKNYIVYLINENNFFSVISHAVSVSKPGY